jgi:hypothetical protein
MSRLQAALTANPTAVDDGDGHQLIDPSGIILRLAKAPTRAVPRTRYLIGMDAKLSAFSIFPPVFNDLDRYTELSLHTELTIQGCLLKRVIHRPDQKHA